MRIQPIRSVVATSLAAVLIAGLAACGGDDKEEAAVENQPAASQAAEPAAGGASAAAITPASYEDPFAGAREAASHMPMTADALAGGIVAAGAVKGKNDSEAADLRSGLTFLLTEHVYLAAIGVATAYHAGPDSAEFKLAAEQIDKNSNAVADAVGQIVPKERDTFYQSWKTHVDDFVAYAVAAKGKDEAGKKKAVKSLLAYAEASGKFFNKATGGKLPASAVQKEFETHITSLAEAVDALAAGQANAFKKLRTAASHMPMSAAALAGGIADAGAVKGDPNDKASELRAGLTYLLTEHLYASGVAVFVAYTDKDSVNGAAFEAAAGAVDANSKAISDAVGGIVGKAKGESFYQSWAQHVTDFVSYAKAAAGGDEAGKTTALENLNAYATAAGKFFDEATGGKLPADAVTKEFITHIESTAGTIDALKAALVKG